MLAAQTMSLAVAEVAAACAASAIAHAVVSLAACSAARAIRGIGLAHVTSPLRLRPRLEGHVQFCGKARNRGAHLGVRRVDGRFLKGCVREQPLGSFLGNAACHQVVHLLGTNVADGGPVVARYVVLVAQDGGNRLVDHLLVGKEHRLALGAFRALAAVHQIDRAAQHLAGPVGQNAVGIEVAGGLLAAMAHDVVEVAALVAVPGSACGWWRLRGLHAGRTQGRCRIVRRRARGGRLGCAHPRRRCILRRRERSSPARACGWSPRSPVRSCRRTRGRTDR